MSSSTSVSQKVSRSKRKRAARIRSAVFRFVQAVNEQENTKIQINRKRQPRKLVNAKQAGRLLGLSPKTLANWRNLGSGPAFFKVGGKCLYLRKDILSFATDRKFASTSGYSAVPTTGGAKND